MIYKNEIIKIALIDSGVNYNNGMNIKRRINLVEGEDDISPLYEDFSGHGTSIASIIASKDEKKQNLRTMYINQSPEDRMKFLLGRF